MGARQSEIWADVVSWPDTMEMTGACDGFVLECLVEAVVIHRRAAESVNSSDVLIKGQKKNLLRNPAISIMATQTAVIQRMCQEFGFSPSARSMIHHSAALTGVDRLDELTGGRGRPESRRGRVSRERPFRPTARVVDRFVQLF